MAIDVPRARPAGRRDALAWLSGALLGAGIPSHANAGVTGRPIRIVVAYPTGGISDVIARALAQALAPRLGVAVQVENQPGAGGAIALRALARALPDGRTLVFSAVTPLATDAALAGSAGVVGRAVAPLASVMLAPSLLVGTPAFAGARFDDLLRLARAEPGALRWATSGVATTGHLVLEQVCRVFGIAVTHIPYNGGGAQLSGALGGQFELLSTNLGPVQQAHVRSGRFKPLAVGAPAHVASMPEVPTLAELGCPAANLASLFGLFAAPGTPPVLARELNAAIELSLQQPALRQLMIDVGNLPTGGSAEAFSAEIERVRAALSRLNRPGR